VTLQLNRKNLKALRCSILLVCIASAFFARPELWSSAMAQDSKALRQSRGRKIYFEGCSSSGQEILAYIGEGALEVPGSTMPCAGCHGLDGRGKSEGGINPSNVTWELLTKPYGLKHADGRHHPPYTERALELAITRGVDPGGNKLLNVMPRYAMSPEDLADLVSYLQLLGKERDPGVSENKIAVATLAPVTGPLAEMGKAVVGVTNAVFEELNRQGGIYGRRLELQVVETAESPSATREKVEALLKAQQVFALSGAIIAGSEKEIVPLLGQHQTPLVGPLTLLPQIGFPLNRHVFYLLSGVDGQARSLLNFMAQTPELENRNVALIALRNEINGSVVAAIKGQKKNAPKLVTLVEYDAGNFVGTEAVKLVRQAAGEVVVFLGGSEEIVAFMEEAEKLNWFPTILTLGSVGPGIFAAPSGFDRKVFFSMPTSPSDQTVEAVGEFRALAAKYNLPATHVAAQLSAYTAAQILIEGIKRAGKDVTREGLIQVLEGFYEYPTGLTPALTYGPNRRVGADGAYVVTIDLKQKQFAPASAWIRN
jgi:ABC-type branched-subunit amino acid transport system substrate-binding protein